MKRVTIKDIANALGIAPSTVSRALSGSTRVHPDTIKRVLDKAKELDYQPNFVASSLRKGQNNTIGILVPRINRHFFSGVVSAIEEVLNPAGFASLIIQSHEKLEKEKQAIDVLLQNRVAGILMSHSNETDDFSHILRAVQNRIPVVQFDRVSAEVPGARFANDNFTGGYLATKHLINGGYKKIAHFAGSLENSIYKERYRGYVRALEESGCKVDSSLVYENAITKELGYAKALEVLKSRDIDAFFCAGDFSAIGVFQAANDLNIPIPSKVGLVGFANEPFAELISPQLSSVEQNAYDMGNMAATAMLNIINRKAAPDYSYQEIVPVRLLVRESSVKDKITNITVKM